MNLTVWQWSILSLGAFSTGLSKTGILGVGVLGAALFANALPARASTGVLLPLLLCADIYGVALFRRHASWAHLWKLFPWVALGLAAGYFALGRIGNAEVRRMIGGILLVLVAWNFRPKRQSPEADAGPPQTWWFAALMGMLAGFTTMVANAAGPVMVLYLLAAGLPKMAFVGTSAWFFLLVNLCKVPLSANLGLITPGSLLLDAALLIPMLPGALLGPVILRRINQRMFELLALALTAVAAVRLLV